MKKYLASWITWRVVFFVDDEGFVTRSEPLLTKHVGQSFQDLKNEFPQWSFEELTA